jgi:hypothetical protein
MKKYLLIGGAVVVVVLIALYFYQAPVGSVMPGGEYKYLGASSTPTQFFKTGSGTLGSVIITKAGAAGATWSIYDSTSTAATLGVPIVTFASDATIGTYTFDVTYYNGLDVRTSTSMGSSTITYRAY